MYFYHYDWGYWNYPCRCRERYREQICPCCGGYRPVKPKPVIIEREIIERRIIRELPAKRWR